MHAKYPKTTILPILVSVVLFMEFLDTSIINTAIPSIARNFLINPILLKFAVASYLLSLAIFIPISGYCADKLGTKFVFIASVSMFVVSSFLCAISNNIYELTIFRFMQGAGGAFMNPVSRIIIVRLFASRDLVKIQGIIFTPALFGLVLGPFLGGIITDYLSWHWIFYVNIPVGGVALYVGYNYIEQHKEVLIKAFDWIGFVISAVSLSTLSFSMEMLNHYDLIAKNTVFTIGIIGIVLFLILIIHCRRCKYPVLNFDLFKIPTFRVGCLVNSTMYALSAAIAFLLPLMFQESFGLSPALSGALVLPVSLGYLIGRPLAAKAIDRYGFKIIMLMATMLVTLWVIMLSTINKTTPVYFVAMIEFLFGACWVFCGASTGALNYINTPKNQTSQATSLDITLRQFSGSMGIAIAALCLTSLHVEIFNANALAFHYTFRLLSLLSIVAMINTLFLTYQPVTS